MSSEFGSDPWIDARLRDVPLPPGVLARLEQLASTSDDELDATMREVPVPFDLLARLERIPRLHRRRIPWRELSLAATLLIAATLSLMSVPLRRGGPERSSVDGSLFVGGGAKSAPNGKVAGLEKPSAGAASTGPVAAGVEKSNSADEPQVASLPRAVHGKPADLAGVERAPVAGTVEPVDESDDSSTRSIPRQDGILAAPNGWDELPSLERVSHSVGRGLAPPLVAGYDFLYQLKTGERPFVSPEVSPALASTPVPLVRDKSTYLSAREAIAGGHLPTADDLRIEDFLSAMDGLYPPTNQPLTLHAAGGPAPFGEAGLQLLEVGLHVGGPNTVDPATGAPRVVAPGATLTVTFNPKVVQAYRLVGHATATLTGPVVSVTQVDLTAGTELASLFELGLKPDGGNDVATIDLAWHDPKVQDPKAKGLRHMVVRVSRGQFAGKFSEAQASLQALAVAAETARVLRSHAAPSRGMVRVLEVAAQVQPQLRSQASFGELVQLATQAEKMRPIPGAGARRATADSEP